MGRKKGHIVTLKPFCYYCDKEFNNELILHQHQKARHFNCVKCRKRFSTAPALDTHQIQVHRQNLKRVPNAKAGKAAGKKATDSPIAPNVIAPIIKTSSQLNLLNKDFK